MKLFYIASLVVRENILKCTLHNRIQNWIGIGKHIALHIAAIF